MPASSPENPLIRLHQLERLLKQCMRCDQHNLRRQLQRLIQRAGKLAEHDTIVEQLAARIEVSKQRRNQRLLQVPRLSYPDDLPVVAKKDDIVAAIRQHQVVIVCGETGSGKTTQLPKLCLEAGRGLTGFIGHTQPRRIAARSVAARIAEELGQTLGQSVGFKIRFQDITAPEAYIKLMTDGILLAESQQDRYFDHYDTLIIDEAHERSLNIDFLLGYLRWLLPKRPDLKLLITSATIDPERFSRHFGGAPIINVSGRTYPVEVRYRPVQTEEEDETERTLQQAILEAADELHRERAGDILVFLSGEREIRETAESLRKHHPPNCEILPLYSKLAVADQDKIFKPHGRDRIVLATNVAETSLTVPGIRCVIDAGHARISRYSPRSKLQRLPIEKISQASANQRAGRCGRIGPGICIRLYSPEDYASRPEFTEPEILRTNLAAVILQMCALGLGDIEQFPFLQPPDERSIRDGVKTLQELNALDAKGKLTAIGNKLAKLPIDPRLGRMLVAAADGQCLTEVSIIVAGLSLQDPRERPMDYAQAADLAHAKYKHEQSDFLALNNLWNAYQEQKPHLTNSKLRGWCRENFLSYIRLREWEDIHHQLNQVIKGELAWRINQQPASYADIHKALLAGLLGNVGFKSEQSEYLGARGFKFQIFPGSFLCKSRPPWIMAAEQVETAKVYARTVAKIEPEWIEAVGAHLVKHAYYDPHWERKPARVAAHERSSLYGLVLQAGRKVPYEKIDPAGAREIFIREALVQQEYDCRAEFFRHNQSLLQSADYLQQKGRRVDLVVDEAWIYRFYDERLPPQVCSGESFDKWRREVERSDSQWLKMTQDDITRQQDERLDAVNYPDHLDIGNLSIKLEYRFAPGDEADGVTAIVPLHQLNQLSKEPFDWLVPGLLREKVIALIKSLPKELRRRLVPVPDTVDRLLPKLNIRQGTLTTAIAAVLKSTYGLTIPPESWDDRSIPIHLRMNYRLVDEKNKVVAVSRDLADLHRRYAAQAGQTFQTLAAKAVSISGRVDWEFGEIALIMTTDASLSPRFATKGCPQTPLPQGEGRVRGLKGRDQFSPPHPNLLPEGIGIYTSIQGNRNNGLQNAQAPSPAGEGWGEENKNHCLLPSPQPSPGGRRGWNHLCRYPCPEGEGANVIQADKSTVLGYPSLVDEGETVGLQAFDTEAEAQRRHRKGLCRLILLALLKDIKYLRKNLSVKPAQELAYGQLRDFAGEPSNAVLRDDLLGLIVQTLYLDEQPDIRNEKTFRERLEQHRGNLIDQANTLTRLVVSLLDTMVGIEKTLSAWPQTDTSAEDMRQQLRYLLHAGFIQTTSAARLKEYPRYLKAVQQRIEKLRLDPGRDRRQLDILQPFWTRYWDSIKKQSVATPETDEFRWLLEEFRVSLFAQQMKTPVPVSAKRLEEAWGKGKA